MTTALRKPETPLALPDYTPEFGRPILAHLRHVARDARCKSYVDLFGACAALSGNRQIAANAASEVLMRCLSQALGRRPVLFREGERDTSFDEKWLLALARALKHEDTASATFLLNSRVPKHARRNLVFLLRNVIDGFEQV
ncbi:hypothetical protein [Marivita sp. GX14005]|uniref:hypothetical protein n=1 Tax=Marivita sp. GX14005 TaxID=2942276 RepID=UPI0020191D15|nr:hypothetical protein [Marivita sp. GX14005]MCL3883276.1 hypothetical protein [Marivita sp. GX14005]